VEVDLQVAQPSAKEAEQVATNNLTEAPALEDHPLRLSY